MLLYKTLRQIRQGSYRLCKLQGCIRYKYLVLDTNLTLQNKYIFDLVHLKQKEG